MANNNYFFLLTIIFICDTIRNNKNNGGTMTMFKIEYNKDKKHFTKKVKDNVKKDCPILSKFVMRYWDWDIDHLKITNLDTGQVMDYDKETSLRGDND